MKLYGTFTCGHEGQIEIFGTKSQREWQEKKAFSKECPECAERSRAKAAEEAAAAAEELGYKPLTGSVKQVAWATTIRKTWIDSIDAIKDIGGRWDNAISAYRLDPAKYRSIERFADTYGFRISDGAKKLMDEHRSTMDAATTVAPTPISNTMEAVMTENGLIGDLIDD